MKHLYKPKSILTLCLLFIFGALIVLPQQVNATHLMGGEITVTHVTGNSYRITQKIYRDCAGVTLSTTTPVSISSAATGTTNVNLTRVSITDRSILCPGQVSRCASSSGVPGIEEHLYQAVVTLNPNVTYTIASNLNARNNAITTLTNAGNQSMYVATTFFTGATGGNSSPQFLNLPIGNFCAGQSASLSPGGFDSNGDAIVYSLINARQAANSSVVYAAGFNGTNPLSSSTGVAINPNTGQISFTPSVVNQVSVICVRIDEYRNGVKIGEIIRDMQIRMINCSGNTPPSIPALSNVVVPVGQQYCVNIPVTDVNNNLITLTANSGVIPPATFTITSSGAGFTNSIFCFTPTALHAGNTFSVSINATDNSCPAPGSSVRSFNITVPAQCNVTIGGSTTPASCGVADGTATASLSGGIAPYQYTWSGPGGFTSSATSLTGLIAGEYCVTIVDGNSCVGQTCLTVAGGASQIGLSGTQVDNTCGLANGSLSLSATGGAEPYTYSLDGGPGQSSGDFSNLAAGTYTATVTDANGCGASNSFTLVAQADVTPPTALCRNITIQLDAFGNVSTTAAAVDAGSSDGCGAVTLSLSPTDFDCSNTGDNTVTLTVTDGSGNTASCTAIVTVEDVTLPGAHCQPATLDLDANGNATLSVAQVLNHHHEACTVVSETVSQTDFDCSQLGTNTVDVTVTDNSGNVSVCQATVTVRDLLAPVADVAALPTVTGECSASVSAPTATDNCAGTVTGTTLDATSFTAQGTYTVNWTFDDGNGNTSSQTQTVVVDDVTAPVADVAALPTVTGECSASVSAPTATDNCAGTVTGTTLDATSFTAQGTYSITWTYDDGNGNTSSQTQTVVVDDVTAPVADVAALPTVTGECSASVSAPTATDNCAGTVTGTTLDATSFTAQGTYSITWTYDDGNGNTSSQTQTVVVDDVTAPVADVAALPTVTGECSASVSAPTATDNCVGTVTGTTLDATSFTAQGTYTVNWTFDDGNGNTSSQTQTVVVADVTAPVANCKNVTVTLSGGNASITVADVNNGSTDNCGIVSYSLSDTEFNCSNIGDNSVTLTVTDINGNSSSCTSTVTVVGSIPVVSVAVNPSPTVQNGLPNTIYLGYGAQSVTLNASGASTYVWDAAPSLSCTACPSPVASPQTTTSYTVIGTNEYGCTATASQTICVIDARDRDNKGRVNGKVLMCHVPPGNPANAHTISISANAVPAHLAHGDVVGSCGAVCGSGKTDEIEAGIEEAEEVIVSAYPNPFSNEITLYVHSHDVAAVNYRILDITGQFITAKTMTSETEVIGTELSAGIYFIEVVQNDFTEVLKVIKTK
ncbi:MAG: hypothetical protein POELPBGB_00948 [Bacteroidia bacterium]|nr:hypothetical protein [Bacteroidia bacterium]